MIASKEAELARGLAKNLGQNIAKQFLKLAEFQPNMSGSIDGFHLRHKSAILVQI